MATSKNNEKLELLWTYMYALTKDTPLSTLNEIAALYAPTGQFYLNGMTQPPATSHSELISTIQTLATYWKMAERKVVSHVEGEDGTIVNAMDNKLLILGEEVPGFGECEVVKFNAEGKISEYLLYCDSGAVKEVFARKAAQKES